MVLAAVASAVTVVLAPASLVVASPVEASPVEANRVLDSPVTGSLVMVSSAVMGRRVGHLSRATARSRATVRSRAAVDRVPHRPVPAAAVAAPQRSLAAPAQGADRIPDVAN